MKKSRSASSFCGGASRTARTQRGGRAADVSDVDAVSTSRSSTTAKRPESPAVVLKVAATPNQSPATKAACVVRRGSVEEVTPALSAGELDTIVLDPPRTGASAEALASIVALAAPRIVYVSCDPATLARDVKRLLAADYRLASVSGFDLFPNTAHVESVAVFDRASSTSI